MSRRGRNRGIFFDKVSRVIKLADFYNDYTLNIFSDASFIPSYTNSGIGKACYSVLAVCKDTIIDNISSLSSDCTSNVGELKGIRRALSIANIYKNKYKYINIFSDSLYSVRSAKQFNNINYNYTEYTPNINLILEIHYLYNILAAYPDCLVTIYHQSGHVTTKSFNSLKETGQKFMRFNNFRGQIDTNFVRYISTYNNIVDESSRTYLNNNRNKDGFDPITINHLKENGYYG